MNFPSLFYRHILTWLLNEERGWRMVLKIHMAGGRSNDLKKKKNSSSSLSLSLSMVVTHQVNHAQVPFLASLLSKAKQVASFSWLFSLLFLAHTSSYHNVRSIWFASGRSIYPHPNSPSLSMINMLGIWKGRKMRKKLLCLSNKLERTNNGKGIKNQQILFALRSG